MTTKEKPAGETAGLTGELGKAIIPGTDTTTTGARRQDPIGAFVAEKTTPPAELVPSPLPAEPAYLSDAPEPGDLYDLGAEQALCAAALIDPAVFALSAVTPGVFHDERHAAIWQAGRKRVLAGEPADAFLIGGDLQKHGKPDPRAYIGHLQTLEVEPALAESYAAPVLKKHRLRKVLTLNSRIAKTAYNGNGTAEADIAQLAADIVRDMQPAPKVAAETKADLSECPPLAAAAQLDPALAVGASPWLDRYLDFSRLWAPRAYDGFHEAVALWVLSTVAARRVKVDLGGERFTNLYLANVARSSVWTKSTAHKIGSEVIEAAGLKHLLAPDDSTPQALLQRMGRQTVVNWDLLSEEDRTVARLRIAFAGQRGWDFDEFGHKVSAMMRDSGPMADFRGILRKLDDCPKSYEYLTIAHGSVMIGRPYLSLLGSMTPADMTPYAKRGGALWGDGFWARFAFVAPSPDEAPSMGRFPAGTRVIPHDMLAPLRHWHDTLGAPEVEVTARQESDEGDKPKAKRWDVRVGPSPVQTCTLGAGVFDAFYRYHDGLVSLAAGNDNTDLDGNYSRFAEKALRVAALLGSFENRGLIELRHWARAQAIAERWRESLHNLYRTLNAGQSEDGRNEDRVVEIARKLTPKLGAVTPSDVHRYAPDLSTTEAATLLDRLARAGVLASVGKTHKGTPRYEMIES